MPRRRSDGRTPDWAKLYEVANDQAGYFTVAQAGDAGFGTALLAHHLRTGKLLRARRGVLRLAYYPRSEEEQYVEYWLWSHREGVFSHDTALRFYAMSDVWPKRIHLTVPTAWRRRRMKVPSLLMLYYEDLESRDVTWYGAVRVTTPVRTLIDSARDHLSPDLLVQAMEDGLDKGLVLAPDVLEATKLMPAVFVPEQLLVRLRGGQGSGSEAWGPAV